MRFNSQRLMSVERPIANVRARMIALAKPVVSWCASRYIASAAPGGKLMNAVPPVSGPQGVAVASQTRFPGFPRLDWPSVQRMTPYARSHLFLGSPFHVVVRELSAKAIAPFVGVPPLTLRPGQGRLV